jgi:hypothetical protein
MEFKITDMNTIRYWYSSDYETCRPRRRLGCRTILEWVVQKCGLAEDRSSGLCRNVDFMRSGQVGGAEMWTG